MINANDLHIKITAAAAAVLVSFAFIGASVGPVKADVTAASSQSTASGQTISA